MQILFYFVPKCGHSERLLESLAQKCAVAHAVEFQTNQNIVCDRHGWERIRFLENHSDSAPNHHWIDLGCVNVFPAKKHFAFDPRVRNELVHSIERTQKTRF